MTTYTGLTLDNPTDIEQIMLEMHSLQLNPQCPNDRQTYDLLLVLRQWWYFNGYTDSLH